MIETVKTAVDTTSWLMVDADTYRYFFSASAQVFAAIFAVVAIAFTFRHSEIVRQLEHLHSERMSRAFTYKNLWDKKYIAEKLGGMFNFDELKGSFSSLDDYTLDIALESIKERCDFVIANPSIASNEGVRIDVYERIRSIVSVTLERSQSLERRREISAVYVIYPIAVAAIMTIISLIMLGIESFKLNWLVWIVIPIASFALMYITVAFIIVLARH